MEFNELQKKVLEWAEERNILCPDNSQKQLLKTMSELGELADAEIKNDYMGIIDGVGDVIVTLIIFAKQKGLKNIEECLTFAWDEIKDRTGKTENGVFIKDEK